MKNTLLLFSFLLVFSKQINAQGADCASSAPFCTGSTSTFPASTSTTADPGPNYDCLGSQPNPAWYYLQIDNSGPIVIDMSSSAGVDIDFVCWGPFSSPSVACASGLTGSAVDCSFSTAAAETCTIPGAISGEVYVLLITNYSGLPTNISFSQTSGSGSTNCNILCTMSGLTVVPSVCDPATNTYSISGVATYTNPPTTGTLTITNSCSGATQVFNAPFAATSTNYSLTGLTANGAACTVTAIFSDDPTCTFTSSFTAPPSCTVLCNISAVTAVPTACNVTTQQYDVSGNVTFVNAPLTGTLTITNSCGGTPVVLNAPFTSPAAYSFPGLSANGVSCNITAVFSADATCTFTQTYAAPPPCLIICSITAISATPTACNSATQLYDVSGTVTFVNQPSTGTLTITNSCGGTPVVLNAPFVSPAAYSFPGLSATGASCNVTAVFSADAACTLTQSYAAPAPCPIICTISAISATTTACDQPTQQYDVTGNVSFVNQPSTGTLTITNSCGGTPVVLNAPFVSPAAYTFTNLPANSSSCNVTAVFSADASCTFTQAYTSPAPCPPLCSISSISTVTSACDPATNSYTDSGNVFFANPPASGTLVVTNSCTGSTQIFNAPFVSPIAYSFTGLLSNGASCTINAIFSADTLCIASQSYTAPASCVFCPVTASNSGPVCRGDSVNLSVSLIPGATYTWTGPGGFSDTIQNTTIPSVNGTMEGIYTVTVNQSFPPCSSSDTTHFVLKPNPTIDISSHTVIYIGSSTTLTAAGGTTYSWNPITDLSCPNCDTTLATPSETTTYCVRVTENGCIDSSCTTVEVRIPCVTNDNLRVPNAFTPNGDGINDELCLSGWEACISSFWMSVYDRWGAKVYETKDAGFCWDGKYNGKPLESAVYVYFIKATFETEGVTITAPKGLKNIDRQGNFSLVR